MVHLNSVAAKKLVPKSAPKADREVFARPEIQAIDRQDLLEAYRNGARAVYWELVLLKTPWGFRLEDIHKKIHLWHGEEDRTVPPIWQNTWHAPCQIASPDSTVAKNYYYPVMQRHNKILVSLFPVEKRGKPAGLLPATVAADLYPCRIEVYHLTKQVRDASFRASTIERSIA